MKSLTATRPVSSQFRPLTVQMPRSQAASFEMPFSAPSLAISSVTNFGSGQTSGPGLSGFLGSSGTSGPQLAQYAPSSNSSLDRLRQEERSERLERAERGRRAADSRAADAYHRHGDSSPEYERARNEAFQRRAEEFRAQDNPF